LEDPVLKRHEFGRTVGVFYGSNTLGAVAGALLGELFLIRTFGLIGTGLAAAMICVAAAAIAWTCSVAGNQQVDQVSKPQRLTSTGGLPWSLLVVSAGSGVTLLGLEVVWARFLRLYVASSPIAFCVMLAVVLAGIGLGGLISSIISGPFTSKRLLPIILSFSATGTLLCYLLFPTHVVPLSKQAFDIEAWPQIGQLSLILMFPVSCLSGITLPVLVTCVQSEVMGRMNSAGLTILFNTIGAAFGPLIAGFVLLPSFGFQSSLIFFAVLYAVLSLLAAATTSETWRLSFGITLAVSCAIFAVILAIFPYHRNENHFANALRPFQQDGSIFVQRIEGNADTFQLLRRDLAAGPYYYRLVTNSYSMSATQPRSQRYMRLFAYLPLVFRPESENALLLCYGVGVTADALLRDQRLKHLDVVDISKEVFTLADSYTGPGYSNPLRDPRVTTFVQDARFFLQACPRSYDIITGEPPPLKVMGTVNLYTEQFFSLMKDRLKDGGVVSFWLPLYQLTTDETKAILRAFHNVFPNSSLWATSDLEWIMIGIKPPLPKPNEELARTLWRDPKTSSDLVRIGVEVPDQMSALFIMDGDEIARIVGDIQPLTDFYPKRLGDAHPRPEAAFQFGFKYIDRRAALDRFSTSSFIEKAWPDQWRKSLDLFFGVRETRYQAEMSGSNWLAELDLYLRYTRLRAPVLAAQDSDDFRVALADEAARTRPGPLPTEIVRDLIAGFVAARDLPHAIQLLEQEKERGFSNPNDLFLLIYLYCLNGNVDKAELLAAAEARSIQKDSFVSWLWGDLQAEFGFRPPS